MGRLILCKTGRAQNPFFIKSAAINIFSLEELLYFAGDASFISKEEITGENILEWIKNEIDEELFLRLVELKEKDYTLRDFFSIVMEFSSYIGDEKEEEAFLSKLDKYDKMSGLEIGKLMCDGLLKMRKYAAAIEHYQILLEDEKLLRAQGHIAGDVWNNLGVAYAMLGDFDNALVDFCRAYRLNHRPESLSMAAYCCAFSTDIKAKNYVLTRFATSESVIEKEILEAELLYKETKLLLDHKDMTKERLNELVAKYNREVAD